MTIATSPHEVSYREVRSPIGSLHLAATERGLVRVAFESSSEQEVRAELTRVLGDVELVEDERLDSATEQIQEFLSGERTDFDIPLDLRLTSGFRSDVLTEARSIPYGQTQSYGQLAAAVGHPGAARAVGSACASNPIVLVIPCHRIVRSDGSIGQYGGGTRTKASLLRMEES